VVAVKPRLQPNYGRSCNESACRFAGARTTSLIRYISCDHPRPVNGAPRILVQNEAEPEHIWSLQYRSSRFARD